LRATCVVRPPRELPGPAGQSDEVRRTND
jgi:hypothetical protein